MSPKALLIVWGCLLLVGAGCSSASTGGELNEALRVTQSALGGGVTWANVAGVYASGNSLAKTDPNGWRAGAYSNESLASDGYVEFTTGENNTHKMAGLTHVVTDWGYASIDFAIYMVADGTVDIYEDGSLINGSTGFGTYAPGDVFRVQVLFGVVTYLKNGKLLYTSTKTPTMPLLVDAALYTTGATINNVTLSTTATSYWRNVVGVTPSANNILKTGADGWNAGASTVVSLPSDGYAEFTTAEATTYKMAGLTHVVTDSSYDDIDFGLLLIADGTVDIYEDGALINMAFGSYSANDVFRVQASGGVVTYRKNGLLLYTSAHTPSFPLVMAASLYSNGATINNVSMSPAYWQHEVGVLESGHGITKTGSAGWNAGASTIASLTGDGYAEFSTAETTTYKMAGLTHAVIDSSYDDIDFGILLIADGTVDIYEDGTLINSAFGSYAANDVFRVQISGSVVTYLKNGALLYTSTKAPVLPLVVDASLYSSGSTVTNVGVVGDVTWTNVVGVTVVGNNLTKTGAAGWNAGAASNQSLNGDGYVEFTTAETNTHKMAGLTHTVADNGYATIDFAIYPVADGTIDIFEDGSLINQAAPFGTYAPGDVFRVQVSGDVVTYLRNGTLLYTSKKTPTFPLVADASLYSSGATVQNVTLSP